MLGKNRIFIAEDEEAVFTSLKKLLLFSGFEADGTMQPQEVIPMILAYKPHVVLVDLKMPEINGFEICRMLKEHIETEQLPVFILSAYAGEEELQAARSLGVRGFFSKPYDFLQLMEEIKRACAEQDQSRLEK